MLIKLGISSCMCHTGHVLGWEQEWSTFGSLRQKDEENNKLDKNDAGYYTCNDADNQRFAFAAVVSLWAFR